MERIVLWFMLLAGSLAQQDMNSNVFLFPKESNTAHVVLMPTLTKPLDKLTICLRSFTELTREYALFSLAISGSKCCNSFIIFPSPPNFCDIFVNEEDNRIRINPATPEWRHTCVTWTSDTGVIQLWIDGKLYARRVSKKGFSIDTKTSIILGQEQDSFGGGFEINQSFAGEITDVHMWDYVLPPKEILEAYSNIKTVSGNIISWRALKYEIKGDVLVQPKLQCKSPEYGYSSYSQCYEYSDYFMKPNLIYLAILSATLEINKPCIYRKTQRRRQTNLVRDYNCGGETKKVEAEGVFYKVGCVLSTRMERVVLWFALLAGSLGQQDMNSNVFLFPKETKTAHVVLMPNLTKPLDKLTICARSFTELTREHSLFSLALPGLKKDNTFLIFPRPPNFCSVYVNQEENRIKINPATLEWKHTCVTWTSDTGVIQLWIDGKLYARRVSKKGFSIDTKTSIILGQEQDSFGGGFDINQSFAGEITDVHMWDYVLPPKKILEAYSNFKTASGNIISWRALKYEIKGDVLVQPKLQCKSPEYGYSSYYQCYEESQIPKRVDVV
ncbi:uncharacterized protein O3C94_010587 [Discoglossus pictus]